MIPRNPDKPFIYIDDRSGVKYSFRYLTDDLKSDFDALIKLYEKFTKQKGKPDSQKIYKDYCRSVIDFFLVGWEGKGLDPFPKDHPSRYFIGPSMEKMAGIISSHINELCGLDDDEIKN